MHPAAVTRGTGVAGPGKQTRVGAELDPTRSPVQQSAPSQRAPDKPRKLEPIPFQIAVAKPMGRAAFEAAANAQVFGSATVRGQWQNVKDRYTPADSPVEVLFDAALVRRLRGAANAAKGIDSDADGTVAGADSRATDFQSQPASAAKTALVAEIDRRYAAARGDGPGRQIKSSEVGKSELWRLIRDEVLFQHQHLANLPDQIKALIHASVDGRDLTSADYEQLFRIAKQIAALPPGAAADYANKITGRTADLTVFEAAIERYRGELASRARADAERTAVQNKLLGLEAVYNLYRQYRTTPTEAAPPDIREQLEHQLARHGFASVADFTSYIERFEQAFEQGAVRITLDLLAKYAGKLYREQQRYQDPRVVKELYRKLAGFRTQHAEFEQRTQVYAEESATHARDAEQRRMPGNGELPARPPTQRQVEADQHRRAAKTTAEAQIKDLSEDYPIFAEDELPVDKRIDKAALAQAGEPQLASVLQAHIASRNAVVREARGQLEGKPGLVYKLDKLMPAFYAELDIQPGSIHDQIIKDRSHDAAIGKLVVGILLAVAAVALTVVSLGAATPAIVAAGASLGTAGLSTYLAYDEYKTYKAEHATADAGFADDPSVVWLVLAIVGAGVDMAAATRAVGKLAPAAKLLQPGDDIARFTKAVEDLKALKQIDDQIATAAEKAAAARQSYGVAKGELSAALGKAYSIPGPFADPDVYRALVKMAAAKLREGGHSLAAFISELKQARLAAKLAELTPEELTKAKQAWAQAETLARLVNDAALLERLLSKVGDAAKLERLLAVFPVSELEPIVSGVANPERLPLILEHVGVDSGAKIIRQWAAKGNFEKLEKFMERMSGGLSKELAETAGVGTQSIVIDSNTAIALMKDADPALKAAMSAGEVARVNYINGLPPGMELRVANVTVGEVGESTLATKGLPITVMRDSKDYKMLISKLEAMNLGGSKGAADRALIADVFFAKKDVGVVPSFVTADKSICNKLATESGIDLTDMGGKTLSELRPNGFDVTIDGRTIRVRPIAQ